MKRDPHEDKNRAESEADAELELSGETIADLDAEGDGPVGQCPTGSMFMCT